MKHQNKNSGLISIMAVFFFWGFLAASNGVFIPYCKATFKLNQFQSQLIDSAFFGAYFIGSIFLFLINLIFKKDVVKYLSYKNTIIWGLSVSLIGGLLMMLALHSLSFWFILLTFFIIALGFSLQQIAANPFVINYGELSKSAQRLNLAGSINSIGTTIGPIIVSLILFSKTKLDAQDIAQSTPLTLNLVYFILAFVFALAIIILYNTKIESNLSDLKNEETKILKSPFKIVLFVLLSLILLFTVLLFNISLNNLTQLIIIGLLLFFLICITIIFFIHYHKLKTNHQFEEKKYRQLTMGMFAIFFYVGAEVTIQSNLGALLETSEYKSVINNVSIGTFISMYWGSLLIGRWTGSIGAFKMSKFYINILTCIVPFIAFAFVYLLNIKMATPIFYTYSLAIVFLVIAFFIGKHCCPIKIRISTLSL